MPQAIKTIIQLGQQYHPFQGDSVTDAKRNRDIPQANFGQALVGKAAAMLGKEALPLNE